MSTSLSEPEAKYANYLPVSADKNAGQRASATIGASVCCRMQMFLAKRQTTFGETGELGKITCVYFATVLPLGESLSLSIGNLNALKQPPPLSTQKAPAHLARARAFLLKAAAHCSKTRRGLSRWTELLIFGASLRQPAQRKAGFSFLLTCISHLFARLRGLDCFRQPRCSSRRNIFYCHCSRAS